MAHGSFGQVRLRIAYAEFQLRIVSDLLERERAGRQNEEKGHVKGQEKGQEQEKGNEKGQEKGKEKGKAKGKAKAKAKGKGPHNARPGKGRAVRR